MGGEQKVIGGKCDTCNTRLEIGETVYTYVTPSQAASPEDARENGTYWCEDPEWGLCWRCHERVQRFDNGEMTEDEYVKDQAIASFQNQRMLVFGGDPAFNRKMEEDQLEFIVGVIKSFARFRQPGFTKEVNEGVLEGGGRPG